MGPRCTRVAFDCAIVFLMKRCEFLWFSVDCVEFVVETQRSLRSVGECFFFFSPGTGILKHCAFLRFCIAVSVQPKWRRLAVPCSLPPSCSECDAIGSNKSITCHGLTEQIWSSVSMIWGTTRKEKFIGVMLKLSVVRTVSSLRGDESPVQRGVRFHTGRVSGSSFYVAACHEKRSRAQVSPCSTQAMTHTEL